MATRAAAPSRARSIVRALGAPWRALDELGEQASFYARAAGLVPKAIRSYKREQVRLVAEVGMSNGALAVIGGSSLITLFITFFAGLNGGVQVYYGLSNLNLEAFGGFSGAIIVPRLLTPIVAGSALAATVGTGFTAQLGAMRISEEIDALEVMSVRSLPYLVSTRVAAGMITMAVVVGQLLRLVRRNLQSLFQHVHAAHRHPVRDDPGRWRGDRGHPDPHLLRLHRDRRTGRRR
jgi:phospholipid/cholesterol/gamma-HCH transport system permease protein